MIYEFDDPEYGECLSRPWKKSRKGNEYLKVEEFTVTVFPDRRTKGRWRYCIFGEFRGLARPSYSRGSYRSMIEAKITACEELDRLLK